MTVVKQDTIRNRYVDGEDTHKDVFPRKSTTEPTRSSPFVIGFPNDFYKVRVEKSKMKNIESRQSSSGHMLY